MSEPVTEPHLSVEVTAQRPDLLELTWTLDNLTGDDLFVCHLLHRGQASDGSFAVEPGLSYVEVAPGPVVRLQQAIPKMSDDVDEESPVRPFAVRLPAGGRLQGRMVVPVPVHPFDAYRRTPPSDPARAVPAQRVIVDVGWVAAAEVHPLLVAEVPTADGTRPMVKIAPGAQHLARAELALPVLAIPPSVLGPGRSCAACGATNHGEQTACLRCGGPLGDTAPPSPGPPAPAPAPVAPPAPAAPWHATHTIPPGGLDGFPSSDRSVVVPIDAGVPVQVLERSGDWARIVASNGWTAWVDGRRLVPLG